MSCKAAIKKAIWATLFLNGGIWTHSLGIHQDSFSGGQEQYVVFGPSYDMRISAENFSFSFWKNGDRIVPEHARSGIFLSGIPTVSSERTASIGNSERRFLITNARGEQAQVSISLEQNTVSVSILPLQPSNTDISLALGGMANAHGLGDAAAYNESFNIVDNKQDVYVIQNDGAGRRWVSTFAIFPQNEIAGVFFDKSKKTVKIDEDEYLMTVTKQGEATFYFFLGDPKTIYSNYKKVRQEQGYQDVKPKFRLFEVGWESWDALGWNTNQFTVQEILQKFHDNGYPIRWAVTGSGYWVEGGTTTSFGRWGEEFPDASTLKEWMHSRDIYWMIGLRTNFIPEGGPYYPETSERDRNLDVRSFMGNKLTFEAEEKGFLVLTGEGEVMNITSDIFPIVPSNLLNGNAPGAAQWFQRQYSKWEIDGIKEDTMMDIDTLTYIYNRPITEIANEGGHVIARNGEFVSPGTLLRINDTTVDELAGRIPINYMQYAASGFPNVYSDVAGTHNMHNLANIDKNIRHAWLLSLTSGFSVGTFPDMWPEEKKEIFKGVSRFHFQIAPYMYSEALKGYQSGYPTTLTPLSIAFPDDQSAVDHSNYQWMIGESLMATPLLKNIKAGTMDVYLPEGDWYHCGSGKRYEGPLTLKEFETPLDAPPCFVGGQGIIILREADDLPFKAKVYPVSIRRASFSFYYPDGVAQSLISYRKWDDNAELVVIDQTLGSEIPFEVDTASGSISFDIVPNHAYDIVEQ